MIVGEDGGYCEVGWGGPSTHVPPSGDIGAESFGDSAAITHEKPLYDKVRDSIDQWRTIGANDQVLEWIESGVHIEPDS